MSGLLLELAQRGFRVQEEGGELLLTGPAGSLTPELRAALAEQKQELLALLRRRSHAGTAAGVPDPARRHDPFPLTDIQQAYWVGRTDALGLGGVSCHYYQEFESSVLELGRLEEAFQKLIRHHDMLRAIVEPDGRQRILAEVADYRIPALDVRGLPEKEAEAALLGWRGELSCQAFLPNRWPLYEVRAALLGGGRMRVYLSFDLLMIDAASMSLLIRDWERFYREQEPIQPPSLSFRDYVVWENGRRESGGYRKALEYWDARLDSLPPPPELPAGSGQEGEPKGRERRKGRLGKQRWERLKSRGEALRVTPSALLAAAFGDIAGAWSRGVPFLLNLTLCRRRPVHPDVEALLGDFTTTVLLAVDPRPGSFRERAIRVHEQISSDMDWADVSGVEVLRRLRRKRPEFPQVASGVVFTSLLGHRSAGILFSSNWLGELVYGVSQTPQVALDHQAFEEEGGLVFHWDFVPGVFAPGVVDAMFDSYQRLLELLADEEQAWSARSVSLIPRQQMERRAAANHTHAPLPDELLHTLAEKRAGLQAELPAVVSASGVLTYGELDRMSLRLARHLRRLGAVRNRLVAVVMEKGWEEIVAVLGILRAGAAYLPIDARLPPARIQHLLAQGEVGIAITQGRMEEPGGIPPEIHRLPIPASLEEEAQDTPYEAANPGDLAYVIFTSGSTGEPKGVMIDHRGAVNTILDINRRFQVCARDRILAVSSLGFDLSVYDIFGTLAAGGTIVVPSAGDSRDPQKWAEWLLREKVTIWNSVPALMRMLTEYAATAGIEFPDLRLVLLSGDWIPPALPGQIRRIARGADVISLGGATEASIWSIWHPANGTDPSAKSVPYGKALANQAMHVLNGRFDPSPDFVRGEIFIGGAGLAKGYWRNPEETAARFLIHPVTGERLYRTGDLGRVLPDGNIELLGREDFQVKIQGHRIELGEIESVLRRLPEIQDAIVVARADRQGVWQLVAYIVAGAGAESRSADWRSYLAERLPSYMLPASFVRMDALPLTANNKVNRAALPEAAQAAGSGAAPVPVSDVERQVTEIVRSVLGKDGFSTREPLFTFGCTSLHVVQIHRRLCETFGAGLSIADIFNRPTIALIAELLCSGESRAPVARATAAGAGVRARLAARRGQARRQEP